MAKRRNLFTKGALPLASLIGLFFIVTASLGGYLARNTNKSLPPSFQSPDLTKTLSSMTPLPSYTINQQEVAVPPSSVLTIKTSPIREIVSATPAAPSVQTKTGVDITTGTNYYSVYGSNETHLRIEMNQKGPQGSTGEHEDGYTAWNISWNYQRKTVPQGCSADQILVRDNIKTLLPKWENETDASQALQSKWDNFLKNLELHEKGHHDINTQGVHEVFDKLSALGSYPDCTELDQAVNRAGQATLNGIRDKDINYDALTDHGRLQGAVFP